MAATVPGSEDARDTGSRATGPHHQARRVLIVGRSPSVLLATVDTLRHRGYLADATNQFDDVLADYDVSDLDILVFGGMVPADTKRHLRTEIARLNPAVTFIQGLGGIAGLIAAQVDAAGTTAAASTASAAEVGYDSVRRSVQITLAQAAHATVEAWWITSFQPPEPRSAAALVFDGRLEPGRHTVPMPDSVPAEASFTAVRVADSTHVFTVGAVPSAISRMAPTTKTDQRLPEVAKVSTGISTN